VIINQKRLGGNARSTVGKYIPSTVLALKIAAIFEVSVEQVFELEEGD